MMIRYFYAIATLISLASVQGISLVETTCVVRVAINTNGAEDLSLQDGFQIETTLASSFGDVLVDNDIPLTNLANAIPLNFHVDVTDRLIASNAITVVVAATLLYEYDDNSVEAELVDLEALLTEVTLQNQVVLPSSYDASSLQFISINNGSNVLDDRDASRRSSTEIGLIVAASLLSFMLLTVSSVLLYITGGWKMCKRKVINCLFEEVDEDEYIVEQKGTYPAQRSQDEEDDSVSNMTSVAPSHASGILGVARNRDNPAYGLGITAHDEDDESSMMYGDDTLTPMSQQHSKGPLGITSMRKLKKPSPRGSGGLSGMVMQRFARDQNK